MGSRAPRDPHPGGSFRRTNLIEAVEGGRRPRPAHQGRVDTSEPRRMRAAAMSAAYRVLSSAAIARSSRLALQTPVASGLDHRWRLRFGVKAPPVNCLAMAALNGDGDSE